MSTIALMRHLEHEAAEPMLRCREHSIVLKTMERGSVLYHALFWGLDLTPEQKVVV